MKESIVRLRALEKQRFAYRYALNVVDFDAETVAPEGSADGRAEACEVLSRADFDLLVNDNTAALLRQAAQDAETEQERAEVRELQRAYDQISKIPADEYAAFTKLTQQSTPAWVKAKRTNDFSVFAPYLEKIVAARRAQAHARQQIGAALRVHALEAGKKAQGFQAAEVVPQGHVLRQVANAPAHLARGGAKDGLAAHFNAAAGGRQQAQHHLEQRAFACAVVADQAKHLAAMDVQRDRVHGGEAVKAFGDIAQGDHGVG